MTMTEHDLNTENQTATEPVATPSAAKAIDWKALGLRLKEKLRQPSFWFVVLSIMVVSIIIPIVILMFGLDQKLFPTSLQGTILDGESTPVAGAQVTIQGQTTSSNAQGEYNLEGLKYGKWNVKVEKNGYVSIDEELRLGRGKNRQEYTLLSQEYGVIRFEFETAEVFQTNEFVILLNDQTLEIGSQSVVNSDRLLVGSYRLRISSPYYSDIDQLVQVLPGEQTMQFSLVEAGDVVAEVRDLLSNAVVVNARGYQLQNGTFIELSSTQYEMSQGKLQLKDLLVDEQVKLKFSANGFYDFTAETKVKQGVNSLGSLLLVPSGQLVSLVESAGQSAIYLSRFDGSSSSRIYSTSAYCRELTQTRSVAYIDCPGAGLVEVDLTTGGNFTHSYRGDMAHMDIWNQRMYVVENAAADKLKLVTGKEVVLYSGEESLTSIGTTRGGKVIFTTENSIWSVNSDGSELVQISTGRFLLSDISSDSRHLLLLNVQSNNSKNIWTLDLNNNEKRKLTYLPGDYKDLRFIAVDTFVFIDFGKAVLGKQTLNATSAQSVATNTSRVLTVLDYDLMIIYKIDGTYLFHNASGTTSQFVLK